MDATDVLLKKFKLNNDWHADFTSLNNFYMEMLQDDKAIPPEEKAHIMQQLCWRVDSQASEMENLRDCLVVYYRLCQNCNALHAPDYSKYGDLFCRKCGECLCVPDHVELDLGVEQDEDERDEDAVLNRIKCAYCDYKNAA